MHFGNTTMFMGITDWSNGSTSLLASGDTGKLRTCISVISVESAHRNNSQQNGAISTHWT